MKPTLQTKLQQLANRVADRVLTPDSKKDGEAALTDAIDALKVLTGTYVALEKNRPKSPLPPEAEENTFAAFQAALEDSDGSPALRSHQGRRRDS